MQTNLKSLIAKLNTPTRHALESAANQALARTHHEVDIEHVLLALLDSADSDFLAIAKAYGLDPADLEQELQASIAQFKTGNTRNPVLSQNIPRWLEAAWLVASVDYGAESLRSGFLLFALLADAGLARVFNGSSDSLRKLPLEELRTQLPAILRLSRETDDVPLTSVASTVRTDNTPSAKQIKQPALDKFTIDLTREARAGKIDPVLGRDTEIRQMIDILLRRRQNNPILTGEPGVGKTAVVEGLALRIAHGDVPEVLQHSVVRTLDLGLLQAGASVKGEFENRMRGVIDEVKASLVPIILFIDEAHTMIGAGGPAGQSDAANLLKPALARGELRTIAATTWSEYKKYFEKDAALARHFQVVKVEEPSEEAATQMLRGIVRSMEKHHQVVILDEAVTQAVKLSSRYITGRQLPDKGVSVLDTACARVALSQASRPAPIEDLSRLIENIDREAAALAREQDDARHAERQTALAQKRITLTQMLDEQQQVYAAQRKLVEEIHSLRHELHALESTNPPRANNAPQKRLKAALGELAQAHAAHPLVYECVDGATVADIISGWTGIPLGRMVADELDAVRNLQTLLEARVIGQSHALALIARRIQISRANLEDPSKPKGVFLLAGPSGVGKTETALALADALYGGEKSLITINMSEYQEAHSVSGLKGSPPGYVGYGEGGVLTEAVRRKPYSVVLLDEVEKAHPDVLELFFQVFDKGQMEDAEGQVVDFKNTVILLTTNIGTDLIMHAVEHGVKVNGKARAPTPEDLIELLRSTLQKSFKPAFLGRLNVVPYYPVQDDVLKRIVQLKLSRVSDRVLKNHGAALKFDDALVDLIASRCTEVDSGARNADAIISNTVLSALSDAFLMRMAENKAIKRVTLSVKRGKLEVAIDDMRQPAKKKK